MSIKISGYTFEGPYSSTDYLDDRSGVYAILCDNGEKYGLVDVGESATVKSRVENHDREDCWKRKCSSPSLRFAVHYTPHLQQSGRTDIEQEIRSRFPNLCGTN